MYIKNINQSIGPGLLLAAAAIGVSHIMQSTRAGAEYGLIMIAVVLFACLIKYPSFRVGSQYTAATGNHLISAYKQQGRWALSIYSIIMFIGLLPIQAGVTFVASAIIKVAFELDYSIIKIAIALTISCYIIIIAGLFKWLDIINKILMVIMALTTVIAAVAIIPQAFSQASSQALWSGFNFLADFSMPSTQSIAFTIALIGWMPSAIEITIWQSIWSVEKQHLLKSRLTRAQADLDFNVSYIMIFILAVCFVWLGAIVMQERGLSFEPGPEAFANQFISLYTMALGSWAAPFIKVSASAVMISTVLAVIDANPRALHALRLTIKNSNPEQHYTPLNRIWLVLYGIPVCIGAILLISVFVKSLSGFIDIATTIAFFTAPILAWLNHKAMHGDNIPEEYRPSQAFTIASLAAIVILSLAVITETWLRWVA